ncbi:SRPBCC domain-containing protein [Brevundimonas sp. BR2-1]|uniref:SRPBCC family protein n=1 Tax=Brevundimonas sp. BR2-1 TaxID=3031123 RepID=UPI00309A364F
MSHVLTETRSVVVERDFAFPPEKLWRALTQPHLIEAWLMKNDFQPVVGHGFKLTGEWGGVLDCEVLAVEPEKTLSYTWDFKHDDPAYGLKSVVTFTLTPTAKGTHLHMEQAGFRPDQKQAFGGAHAGWGQFFGKLEQTLAEMDEAPTASA